MEGVKARWFIYCKTCVLIICLLDQATVSRSTGSGFWLSTQLENESVYCHAHSKGNGQADSQAESQADSYTICLSA